MKKIISVFTMFTFLCTAVFTPAAYSQAQYTVSGFVKDKSGIGIHDVEIRVNGDIGLSMKTDSTGYYRFDNISNGSKIEITATKDGMSISPAVFKINALNSNRTVNFRSAQSLGSASADNVPTIPKPVTGVTQTQPTYVQETKSFFASDDKQPPKQTSSTPKSLCELSGKVTYYASGLVGVRVMINNDRKLMTTTDVNGYYSIKGLKTGSEISVSYSKDGYEFNPSEYSILTRNEDITLNVSAKASTYKISGVVTEKGRGIEGVLIKITDGLDEYEAESDERGYYEVTGLPYGRNFLVTANKDGVVLTPLKTVVNKILSDRNVNFSGIVRKYNISGKVTDAKGKGIKYASVFLKTKFDTHKIITNSKGAYTFEDMPSDLVYTATAAKEGYKTSEPSVISDLQQDLKLDFKLEEAGTEVIDEIIMPEEDEVIIAEEKKPEPKKEKQAAVNKKSTDKKKAVKKQKKSKKEEPEPFTKSILPEPQEGVSVADVKAELAKDKEEEFEKREAKRREAEEAREAKKIEAEAAKEAKQREIDETREAKEREIQEEKKSKASKSKRIVKPKKEKKKKEVKSKEIAADISSSAEDTASTTVQKSKSEQSKDKTKNVRIRGYIGTKTIPIANIELSIEPGGYKTFTDEKGRYSFDSIPANPRYLLRPNTGNFNLEPSESILNDVNSNVNQDFTPNVWLEGEVLAEGLPVPDVVIQLNGVHAAVTNNFGKFRIEKVEYGTPVTITAQKAGYSFYPQSIDVPQITTNKDDFDFYAAFSVAGRVTVQGSGLGLGNIEIEVSGSTSTVAPTDYGGNFFIQGLEQNGNFKITPKAGGYSFNPPSRDFYSLKSNFVGQNFTAIKETYTIKGSVFFGRKPVKNAIISITKRALKYFTDENGNFEIANLDYGGPYILTVENKEYHFEPVVIDTLQENMTVDFSNDISLGGTIMSGGKPLPNIVVDVNGKREKTDEKGNYLVKGLGYDGDYLLTVSAPGIMFVPAQKEYKRIKKSMLSENIEASLVVSGRITHNNKGLEGATVIVSGDTETYQTDENGYYFISNLKYGRDYVVEVVSLGYKFDPPKREYRNFTKARMSDNYQATPIGYEVKGTVKAEGRTLRRVPVLIEGDSKKQVLTNDEGVFVFEGLAPNRKYKLNVFSKIYKFESPCGIIDNLDGDTIIDLEYGKVSVPTSVTPPGKEELLDIEKHRTKQASFTISGRVIADGKPLQNAVIMSELGEALTNEEGEYTLSVQSGDNIKIKPSLGGYVFTPENTAIRNIAADQKNVNFTAEMKVHKLTGYVLNNTLKGVKGVEINDLNYGAIYISDAKGFYEMPDINHNEKITIVPESDKYNFFPEKFEVSLENDMQTIDIYAYPKKVKRAEAFVYGGTQGKIDIEKNRVSIVMISPTEGRVSVSITDAQENAIKEFLTDISADIVAVIEWDGMTSFGNMTDVGEHYVVINGAGFNDEIIKFEIK